MDSADAPVVEARGRNGQPWSSEAAAALYQMVHWSDGYFGVNEAGRVGADPERTGHPSIDLYEVVTQLREKHDLSPPVLLRFQDVLEGRIQQLNAAFAEALEEFDYKNSYTTVFPIKANQLREVVEAVLEGGAAYDVGLECGSKAELVAGLSYLKSNDRLLICNGFKDADMLRLILEGQRLGKSVLPVVEQYPEFEALCRCADEQEIAPQFGVRVQLATGGAGKWSASSGEGAKFGLQVAELLQLARQLEADGRADALTLLHFHLGSQINDIRTLKKAVREASHVYAQLRQRGLSVDRLDVGGGLGVYYGSGKTGEEHSINYTMQEYANSVVETVHEVCTQQDVPVPALISESGRALTAHHAVLVVEAVDAFRPNGTGELVTVQNEDHPLLADLRDTYEWIGTMEAVPAGTPSKLLEAHHDVEEKHEQIRALFEMGYISLDQKARAEQICGAVRRRISDCVGGLPADELPDELAALGEQLVDQYLCSFSVFQSLLDHWAIGQPFPAMPLHRLDEEPSRRAVLVDLTCDSDGKITRYVGAPDHKTYLDVHPLDDEAPYYLGVFLTGAYQDIMGDVHNLLGRLPEAHVYADSEAADGYQIDKVIDGDTVRSMLEGVQYRPDELEDRMATMVRESIDDGMLAEEEAKDLLARYRELLDGTTYYRAGKESRF